jgi:GxxExxY protein
MLNTELWIGALCRSDSCARNGVGFTLWRKENAKMQSVFMNENEISKIVVDLCFKIHKQYGAGLFESVYEEIFCYEWGKMNLPIVRQKGIKVIHDGVDMGIAFIPDLIVCNKVILELKSIEMLAEVHYKQLLTYLKLTNLKLGLLINFKIPLIKDGIHRIVNNL